MKHLIRKTNQLTIRPLIASDYDAWRVAFTTMHPQKNKWDKTNKSQSDLTRLCFRRIISNQKKLRSEDRFYDLAVFENRSKCLVGSASIMDVARGLGQSAFLGYTINNPYWGRGFGKEATQAVIDIAFRDLKLHRIEAGIEPYNRRSIFLARSIGLRKEGLKKRAVYLRGQWNDLIIYSATCEEFGYKWKGTPQTRPR